MYASLLWIMLLIPAIGSAICPLLRSSKAALRFVLGAVIITAAVAVTASLRAFLGGPIQSLSGWLYLDALSAFHLLVMAVVFVMSSIYAIFYFGEERRAGAFNLRSARRFASLWLGVLGAIILVLVSNNLGMLWVGIEGTTLLTAFLICIHRTPASLEAMWKYLIICSVGIAFAFFGTLFVGAAAERLRLAPVEALLWTKLQMNAGLLDPTLLKVAFLFLLVGYGTKVGLAPMHSWLPDAHSQAPAPVSALFSGFMLNSALYCIMRYVPLVEGACGRSGWSLRLLTFFGIASILVAAAFIYFQRDVKRLLAYSTIEHMGIIALGVGLGGLGTFAALFHTLNHSLCKSVAFFSAGSIGQNCGTHDIDKLKGALRSVPVWGKGLLVSILALIGVAPFGLFLSELLVMKAAADEKAYWTLALYLFGLCVIFLSALRHIMDMFYGNVAQPPTVAHTPPPTVARFRAHAEACLVAAPLAVLLALGLWMPQSLQAALRQAAAIVGGGG